MHDFSLFPFHPPLPLAPPASAGGVGNSTGLCHSCSCCCCCPVISLLLLTAGSLSSSTRDTNMIFPSPLLPFSNSSFLSLPLPLWCHFLSSVLFLLPLELLILVPSSSPLSFLPLPLPTTHETPPWHTLHRTPRSSFLLSRKSLQQTHYEWTPQATTPRCSSLRHAGTWLASMCSRPRTLMARTLLPSTSLSWVCILYLVSCVHKKRHTRVMLSLLHSTYYPVWLWIHGLFLHSLLINSIPCCYPCVWKTVFPEVSLADILLQFFAAPSSHSYHVPLRLPCPFPPSPLVSCIMH